jgi:hypothetical protein
VAEFRRFRPWGKWEVAVARSLLVVVALASSAWPAFASDIGGVKCGPNQDRVWVYESLNSFDVETRLKCGETVEILARVRGYVKIRTASGVEGYVPDAAFPDLPALPPDAADRPVASLAVRAASGSTTHAAAVMPPVRSTSAVPTPARDSSALSPGPVVAAQPSTPAKPAVVVAAKKTAGPAAVNPTVASTSGAHAAADVRTASAVAKPAQAKTHDKSSLPAAVAEPSAPKKAPAKPASSNTQSAKATIGVPQPAVTAAMVVPAKATPKSAAMMEASAEASPAADVAGSERDPDLEEYPDAKPENESADPACRVFFSAYGLNPAQYKWMVENRHKQYASICPAGDLAHVDFVILFAHDSDTYNSAMPVPVHTDRNGFSDFSPMTTVDTALQSMSELDKARYEFVWVFHTKRGTFDPARFSARRRPLFTTDAKGSHAAARAVDDAFQFIEGQGNPGR